jgi:hypothetical protein
MYIITPLKTCYHHKARKSIAINHYNKEEMRAKIKGSRIKWLKSCQKVKRKIMTIAKI